ncbi:MAG: protocatechuate 3,4-dioxygenase subunit alpha [Rhabdaerophilum sp.]
MPVDYLKETPSQTAGPYVHIGTLPAQAGLAMRADEALHIIAAEGERLAIEGLILDGSGTPVRDAMIELWQADASGRVGSHGLWGRAGADGATGEFRFETVRPGSLFWSDGRRQAQHVSFLIFARGINIHLHTRMYFPEDTAALAADPVLGRIEQHIRRQTLVAEKLEAGRYRFVIRLQGEAETVFLDA